MASQRRQPRSERTEAKAPPRRDLDLNKERLIFCLSSLIGHKVTAKLRGNVIYEGVFHSCALEGDFSIILKHARLLPSEQQRSGNVIDTLIIPGKDFLQVNAMDVATPDSEDDSSRIQGGAFATDGEITSKRGVVGEENRELVAWSPGVEGETLEDGALGNHRGKDVQQWDQFEHNEKMFGVASTFNEEYYTTKLDPNSISPERREEADRIAKEIESGTHHGDKEDKDYDEDEEARFSAVQGTGAFARKTGASSLTGSSSAAPSSKARGGRGETTETAQSSALSLPVSKAGTEQVDASQREREFQRDYRKQRGMVLTHSPMHSSMISEMKRINALNLEPAVPKLDDKTGSDWINFKQSQQSRNKANPVQGDGLKHEFEQALADFRKREAEKKGKDSNQTSSKEKESEQSLAFRKPEGNAVGSESTRSSGFKFNPNANSFSFNASAAVFTPGMTPTNSNTPAVTPSGSQAQNSHQSMAPTQSQPKTPMVGTGPQFITFSSNPELLRKKLDEILDGFFDCSNREHANVEPTWTDATGPSYKEILGPPNPSLPMGQVQFQGGQQPPWQQPPIAGQMPGPGGPPPGQPGAPMMQQPGPFMMPQPGPGGQQPGQMFAQPMYPAPTGAPMQRPPAGGGNMPPQGQQPMAFQQGMVPQQPGPGGGPQMPMHQGVPNQGNVMNMPKNYMGANMVMMVPAGQTIPQGFAPVPMQGQPGQQMQGQPGPGPQGNPQQGQMMRPMYMPGGQMGGGPPHQMPSHDG